MVHSRRVSERPRPGSQKPTIGATYSANTASAHSASRVALPLMPPASHNTADRLCQPRMRR